MPAIAAQAEETLQAEQTTRSRCVGGGRDVVAGTTDRWLKGGTLRVSPPAKWRNGASFFGL